MGGNVLTLQELLNLKTSLFRDSKVKLVRHKDSRAEYRELIKNKHGLLEYQREQAKDVFRGCDYIISFVGTERRRSIFFGVFRVEGVIQREGKFYYDLTHLPEFAEWEDRLVIDWGGSALAWHQWYKQPKDIVEILPRGYLGNFPGLLDFVLDYEELQKLVANPEANADWKHHLSAVNGIYLILDTLTGQQYIGSAYGEQGIWQRWAEYARTGTGGNRELIRLLETDPHYARHFRFSLLQSLPSNRTQREVIPVENLYKQKLGSRVHGLNGN
jgi:hypothetical protein